MKNNKGITLTTLVITIVVLLIIAGISIETGNNMIKKSQLENLKTNMLLIKVKGKEYAENANFKLGTSIDTAEDKEERIVAAKAELKGEEITEDSIFNGNINITLEKILEDNVNLIYYYKLTEQNLIDIGITNVKSNKKDGWYIIKYDLKNVNIEVYNTKGFKNEQGTYYTLNELQNIEYNS